MPQTTEFKLGVDGVASFEFDDGTTKTVDLGNLSGGGAGTNLTISQNSTTVTVNSDTGTDATIPAATTTLAGTLSAADKTKLDAQPATPVTSVATRTGAVVLTKADVGLTNVDNTADTAKPVSTAQQTAINLKQDAIALGTNKLLSAPATNGGAPVQITLGTNLSLSGTTLNATGGGSTTVVNDLTTGGTTSALSAEMGKTLQGKKVDGVNASAVVGAGVTTINRTAVTTAGAEAPFGYYNRPLLSDHSLTVDLTGAVAGDAIMVLNTSASSITVTAGGLTITIPASKTGEMAYNGTAFVDTTPATGAGYTDAQALAAAVLAGTLGTSSTQAPTHIAVANAIAAGGGSGNVVVIAPSTFTSVPPGTTNGLLTTLTVPANTIGTRGVARLSWEVLKGGTTDVIGNAVRIGPVGGSFATATTVYSVNIAAGNGSAAASVRVRAVGTTLRVVSTNSVPEGTATPANTITPSGVDPASGFVIYIAATNIAATDTTSLIGASITVEKVA